MADEYGEKTEAPTPRRRSEARKKGQVARSQELSATVLMLTGLMGLLAIGPRLWRGLLGIMQFGLGADGLTAVGDLPGVAAVMAVGAFRSVGVLMLVLVVVATLVLYAQVGPLLTLAPLAPKLEKLNPLAGVKRMFSARTAVQLAVNLAKLVLVCAVAYGSVMGVADRVLLAATLEFPAVFGLAWELVFNLGVRLGLVLLVIALFDYAYQKYRHEKDLKMSRQEVKEELKRMDGDPVLKRRRREVQMQLALQRIRRDVPKADVVVANPTHYAVALRYDAEQMSAPKVVAKGADYLALRIRDVAAAAGVVIVERPVLARMLYAEVAVGREVPGKFFEAVAEILAYVYDLTNRRIRPQAIPVG